jgi:hypothetical protein
MKTKTKALIGTVAAGALVLAPSAPAFAQGDRDDGIDAGEIIAGALILGGIAAVVAATSNNDRYDERYDDRYANGGYYSNGRYYSDGYRGYDNRNNRRYANNVGSSRGAVEQCVYAAENNANRYSYGGGSQVTDIRQIDRKRDGYTVKGRIAVNQMGRNWRAGDARYGRGWNGDYRGWNNAYRGYDSGNFTCKVRYGQVVDLDYSGVRGLG